MSEKTEGDKFTYGFVGAMIKLLPCGYELPGDNEDEWVKCGGRGMQATVPPGSPDGYLDVRCLKHRF